MTRIDCRRSFAIAAGLVIANLLFSLPVAAADLAIRPQQDFASGGQFLAANPSCVQASDRCRTCVKSDSGAVSCSNIGIACQPQRWRCVASGNRPK